MRTYKVLYVFSFEHHSGAEIVMKRLIMANLNKITPVIICPEGGFAESMRLSNCTVIADNTFGPLRWKERKSKFKSIGVLLKKFFSTNLKLVKLYAEYDVVHVNNLTASFYLLPLVVLRRLSRVKFIWSNHDLAYKGGNTSVKLVNLCLQYYDATIAVSRAVKSKYPTFASKIKVLYNGIDLDVMKLDQVKRDNFRQRYDINEGLALGILGSVIPHKGHQMLIKVIVELLDQYPAIRLFIVGRFIPDNDDFTATITNALNMYPQNIKLIEHTDDIISVYSGLDVIINNTLPEVSEPLGTTIYEGMAFEKVVIASNTGGSPEIISDKVNGYLFEAGKEEALKQTLTGVLNNFSNLSKIRINARKAVVEKFNIEKMVDNYNSLLEELHV